MTAALDKIRAEIDALDADLRLRLLRRAELVAEIGAAKADNGTQASPLRPMREMQQMRALRAWQRAEAPMLSEAGLLAIWREIIGMALAQQGGITITASPQAMPAARAHFGASLEYQNFSGALDALADNGRMIGVLTLAEAVAPPAGVGVFARLPLIGDATVLCYGCARARRYEAASRVAGAPRGALPDDRELYQGADYVLVETMNVGDDAVWGHYLTLGDAS
jgi:chorismate mutase